MKSKAKLQVLKTGDDIKGDPELVMITQDIYAKAKEGYITGFIALIETEGGVDWAMCGIDDRFKQMGLLAHALIKLALADAGEEE